MSSLSNDVLSEAHTQVRPYVAEEIILHNVTSIALTASNISILSRETPDVTILSNVKYATQKTLPKKSGVSD